MTGEATRAPLRALYETMVLIRRAEERLSTLFADGEVPGFLHLGIGQEAVPAGVCAVLGHADTVASTHRGHGHALARGIDLAGFFCEILGRQDGVCRGRGGSIHVADVKGGMLGANGIVAGGLPLAAGSALAHQVLGRRAVAVAFFGDGAMAEGALHECLNLASLWKLPLVFVCENNGWGEFSPVARQFAGRLRDIGAAFDTPFASVDGSDVEAVHAGAARCVGAARSGAGPQILECLTGRWRGHYEGDPQKYRAAEDLASARARDPLVRARERLLAVGASGADIAAIERVIEVRVEAAIEAARCAPEPDFRAAAADVYTDASHA